MNSCRLTILQAKDPHDTLNEQSELITFKYFESDGATEKSVQTERLTASQLRTKAIKFVRKDEALYMHTVDGKALSPGKAFETIRDGGEDGGKYTIHVLPAGATVNGQDRLRKRRKGVLRTIEGPHYPPNVYPPNVFRSLTLGVRLPDSSVSTGITGPIGGRSHDTEQDAEIL